MSADCESTLMMEGKLHRVMSLIGDIAKMDSDDPKVARIRLYNWTDNKVHGFERPIPDGTYRVYVDFHYWHFAYKFSLEVARMVLDKYPDIAETMCAMYTNDEYDDCGGYSYEDKFVHYWYVDPEDWKAYLDGDFKNTSQYRRWQEMNEGEPTA